MSYSTELIAELEILALYDLRNIQEGLKVHHTATPQAIAAARRLHEKELITLQDGGYLTTRGVSAAEHAQSLLDILKAPLAA